MISAPLTCALAVAVTLSVVSALRQVEYETQTLAVEDGPKLSDLKLNWTWAVTPRLSEEDLADLRRSKGPRPSAMMQLENCNSGLSFQYEYKRKKKIKLGEGAFGAVYKVKKTNGTASEFYAMKVPLGELKAKEEAEHEVAVMADCQKQRCEHVLPLLAKDPCVNGTRMANALVTKLMPLDLKKWKREYVPPHVPPPECFEVVYSAIRSGLDCMHGAGWLHGDLKLDNVLFESLDENKCPVGLQLADFGLSMKLGSRHPKFKKRYYDSSWHEAGSMFDGVEDTLNLTKQRKVLFWSGKPHFLVDKSLDECSFAMLMMLLFDRRVLPIQDKLGKGACGAMGPSRQLTMP